MKKLLLEKEIVISKNKGSGVVKAQDQKLGPFIGQRVKMTIQVIK